MAIENPEAKKASSPDSYNKELLDTVTGAATEIGSLFPDMLFNTIGSIFFVF